METIIRIARDSSCTLSLSSLESSFKLFHISYGEVNLKHKQVNIISVTNAESLRGKFSENPTNILMKLSTWILSSTKKRVQILLFISSWHHFHFHPGFHLLCHEKFSCFANTINQRHNRHQEAHTKRKHPTRRRKASRKFRLSLIFSFPQNFKCFFCSCFYD